MEKKPKALFILPDWDDLCSTVRTSPPTVREGPANMNQGLLLFTTCTALPLVIAVDSRQKKRRRSPKRSVSFYCLSRRILRLHISPNCPQMLTRHGLEPLLSAGSVLGAHTCMPMIQLESERLFIFCLEELLQFDLT